MCMLLYSFLLCIFLFWKVWKAPWVNLCFDISGSGRVCVSASMPADFIVIITFLGLPNITALLFCCACSHQTQTTCWDHPKMTELYQSLGWNTLMHELHVFFCSWRFSKNRQKCRFVWSPELVFRSLCLTYNGEKASQNPKNKRCYFFLKIKDCSKKKVFLHFELQKNTLR